MKKQITICALLLVLADFLYSETPVKKYESAWYIVQISDPQLGFIDKNQSVGKEVALFETAIGKINSLHPDLVIITGDFVNSSRNVQQLEIFWKLCQSFHKTIGLYKIPGNHDIGKSNIKSNLEHYKNIYGNDHFSITHKGIRLIGLNTCLIKDNVPEKEMQYNWLKQELNRDDKSCVKLVFGHHPFFLADISEKENYSNQPLEERLRYDSLFQQTNVMYYFAGHLHNNSDARHGSTGYITTSALGKQLGKAVSGIRIIRIEGKSIRHLYLPIELIPRSTKEAEQLFHYNPPIIIDRQ